MKTFIMLTSAAICGAFVPDKNGSSAFSPVRWRKFHSSVKREAVLTQISPSKDGISISSDDEYPQNFSGRLWFNPSLVKVPDIRPASDVQALSLFGYSLGGTVTLEYDTSPVGPYREYVTMSALVTKRGAVGQWGSRLYVSTQEAEDVCKDIWGVPAELANIDFAEERRNGVVDGSNSLQVTRPPDPNSNEDASINIQVEGWKNTRVLVKEDYEYADGHPKRWGGVPVLWTPTIKALWAPFVPFASNPVRNKEENLPLHKLRLSASAIRFHWTGFKREIKIEDFSEEQYNLGIPLGVSIIVDNVLIEIGKRCENDL